MYALLGDIVFEGLKGFESLSDKRETLYSQINLINGKPNLQRNGEALNEFNFSIKFHIAFCNPEDEFAKLNNARAAGTILPFIYGNGYNEGSYVITTIEKTVEQTDKEGNYIEINCNIVLLEYAGALSDVQRLEQDRKNAFAISSNRPLPTNLSTRTDNPALIACESNKAVQQSVQEIDNQTTSTVNKVEVISTGATDQAQRFVDLLPKYISDVQKEISKASNALGGITSLISTYASILGYAPTLGTKVVDVQNAITGVQTQLTALGTLPTTISNPTDAATALTAMNNTAVTVKALQDNQKTLNEANAGLVKALALKKPIT